MAPLDHPNIVQLIGVAWDSLADLCLVLELMPNGDLRSLLNEYQRTGHEHGFDSDKLRIAHNVAHALVYLHSLATPVLHRDLKSKNILLTKDLDAKITDFGVSRKQSDKTLTAGVGTSLWMAPEVMMGERYNEKADMFSFGMVLYELDSHETPYANARHESSSGGGNQLSDTAILQLVASGKLQVQFSHHCTPELAQLGVSCMSFDPSGRPSAAEAMYRLQ
jgi:serine/threonine-protein kinase TNNI3K